jgi:hypothetical protein
MPDEPDPPLPDPPVTDEETAKAEDLRAALDAREPRVHHRIGGAHERDDAKWARALAAAWSPRDLARETHQALVEQALSRMSAPRPSASRARRLWVAAVAALAATLSLALWVEHRPAPGAGRARILAVRRSTQPLFTDRFPAFGGETGRIDRIAMTRSSDLRDNEFAKWQAQ